MLPTAFLFMGRGIYLTAFFILWIWVFKNPPQGSGGKKSKRRER
jgi:hypothetical protein